MCPRQTTQLIESPDYSEDIVYNDTSYHCIWQFRCRGSYGSTVLEFLAFNRDDYPLDCDSNFVEIREGLVLPLF